MLLVSLFTLVIGAHSVIGYSQGAPRYLGASLWDRIESYVEESLTCNAVVPDAVLKRDSTSSPSKDMWNLISIIVYRGSMDGNSHGDLNYYAISIVRSDKDGRRNALKHGIMFIKNEV